MQDLDDVDTRMSSSGGSGASDPEKTRQNLNEIVDAFRDTLVVTLGPSDEDETRASTSSEQDSSSSKITPVNHCIMILSHCDF